MTQNNERDLILDDAVAAGADIIGAGERIDQAYEGERTLYKHFLFSENELLAFLKLHDARAQSSISQNEQQDVVAWVVKIPESRRGISNDIVFYYKMSEMLKEHILAGDDVTPLYASPPKQIPEESAWLIEKYINGKLHYAYCDEIGILDWTSDSLAAMRFSRKQDAAQLTSIMEDADRVAEHMWAAPTNTEVGND